MTKITWLTWFVLVCLTLALLSYAWLLRASSESNCLARDIAHDRVKSCLEAKRPAGECLQEAWALCLKDLAEANGR
jgi:sensor domain CHASE-containing protein